jgi:hypothetical protein
MKENTAAIVMPIVLILSSVFSPSRGAEECSSKNPSEILMMALIACVAGVSLFLIFKRYNKSFTRKNQLKRRF